MGKSIDACMHFGGWINVCLTVQFVSTDALLFFLVLIFLFFRAVFSFSFLAYLLLSFFLPSIPFLLLVPSFCIVLHAVCGVRYAVRGTRYAVLICRSRYAWHAMQVPDVFVYYCVGDVPKRDLYGKLVGKDSKRVSYFRIPGRQVFFFERNPAQLVL